MDEARAVLERLERIEALEREGAPATVLLDQVRSLLVEAEAWVRVEGRGTEGALEALEQSRRALAAEAEVAMR